jgi:hypothetical protein
MGIYFFPYDGSVEIIFSLSVLYMLMKFFYFCLLVKFICLFHAVHLTKLVLATNSQLLSNFTYFRRNNRLMVYHACCVCSP